MKWILPVLYIVYYGNILFFSHVHIEATGMYVHAHPAKKTASGESHTHKTLLEIQFIGELSSFLSDGKGADCFSVQSFFTPIIGYLTEIYFLQETESLYNCSLLRAPPSFLSI